MTNLKTSPAVRRGNPWRQMALRVLRAVVPSRCLLVRESPASGSIFLTFDDGPDPETTPRLLDLLEEHSVRATFFVVGQNAVRYPEIVRRMAENGHAVGGHTFYHHAPREVNGRQLMDEVRQTDAVLREILGSTTRFFRPPFGKLTLDKLLRLWWDGRRVVLWNRDPKDFAARSAADVTGWFEQNSLEAGDIVLLHDTSTATVQALAGVIRRTREAGLGFTALAAPTGQQKMPSLASAGR